MLKELKFNLNILLRSYIFLYMTWLQAQIFKFHFKQVSIYETLNHLALDGLEVIKFIISVYCIFGNVVFFF